MSIYHSQNKSDKHTTSNTIPDTISKSRSHPSLIKSSENSFAVANCIRGLNSTIENLLKEKQILMKTIEESRAKETQFKASDKVKKLKEKNLSLKGKVKELNEINNELHERYNRVKEIYDMAADKQTKIEKAEKNKKINLENLEIVRENKQLKQLNGEYLVEINLLKTQVAGYKKKIDELERNKNFIAEEKEKSGKFVNEIAQINQELLDYINHKSHRHKKHNCYKSAASSKKVSKVRQNVRVLETQQ